MSIHPEGPPSHATAGRGDGRHRTRAAALASALARGLPASEAARAAGEDPRVAHALEGLRPSDGAEAVACLAALVAESDVQARELRTLGAYPAFTLLAVLGAAAAVTVLALPALGGTPAEHADRVWPLLGFTASILGLGAMVLVGTGRIHVPLLDQGARARDAHLLTAAALRLRRLGTPLPAALRAAARLAGRRAQPTAHAIADALEAGRQPPTADALLSRSEIRMLAAGASLGADVPALAALEAHHAALARIRVPEQVTRQRTIALCAGGFAVLMVGVVYVTAYLGALGV